MFGSNGIPGNQFRCHIPIHSPLYIANEIKNAICKKHVLGVSPWGHLQQELMRGRELKVIAP